ncbi:hypothetical protein FB451DRAFT_1222283 [Mycena latifolia]|nr:hypothetical protein FB451DRAFT_1222283 [Mycena latifolia]
MEDFEEIIPLSSQTPVEIKEEPVDIAFQMHLPSSRRLPPASVTDMFNLDDSDRPPTPIPFTHALRTPVSSTCAPRNPFVSAGFVTDFVGTVVLPVKDTPPAVELEEPDSVLQANPSVTDPPAKPQSASHRRRAIKRAKLRAEAQAAADGPSTRMVDDGDTESSSVETDRGRAAPSCSTQAGEATAPTQALTFLPPALAPRAARAAVQNAVASSSKVVSGVPPSIPPSALSCTSTSMGVLPREATKAPATAAKQSHKGSLDIPSSDGSTPPPDLKAIAYIPTGPSSNPLNIRPSGSSLPSTFAHPTTLSPALTRPTSDAATKTKKRVLVGRGWPFVRAATVATAATAPASQPAAKSGDLSTIVGYSSPSPPSLPANHPPSKWKRIDSEISIARDDSPVDMVLSDPPSPIAGATSARIHSDSVSALGE